MILVAQPSGSPSEAAVLQTFCKDVIIPESIYCTKNEVFQQEFLQ